MNKKWIYDEDDEARLFYGDEEFNGSAYPCDDPFFMKIIANKLNELEEENEELKKVNKQLSCTIVEIFDFIEDKGKELME